MAAKDFGVLALQPSSASPSKSVDTSGIVISAVITEAKQRVIVSRYDDPVWKMWPFFEQSNQAPYRQQIDWTKMPERFIPTAKAILYRYWMVGRPRATKPSATTVVKAFNSFRRFACHLDSLSLDKLSDVRPLHVASYVQACKLTAGPSALAMSFAHVELLYVLRDQHPDAMTTDPWPGSSAYETAGATGVPTSGKQGKTEVIPQDVLKTLFEFCEATLGRANQLLDERDARRLALSRDPEIYMIRNACFFLIGILTGMRCEEIVGIEVGAARREVRDGVEFHWIKSIEHKTKKGNVEYFCASLGHRVLRVMERWSEPYRHQLEDEVLKMEKVASIRCDPELLQTLRDARVDSKRLFLGTGGTLGLFRAVSGNRWIAILKELAEAAGTTWQLAPHQLRRTYAWTFVRHRLGNLLLLKDQFKHSALEMTQLYAANPMQDETLYEECLAEVYQQKADVVLSWLNDAAPMAGGAGRKIMLMRANDFPNRRALIEETADKVSIRSTGHSWCLAQGDGCGGAGLYERTRCGPCSNSVIDQGFTEVWQEIHRHQLELLDDIEDLGPGAKQRVQQDLQRAVVVLRDLGVSVEGQCDDEAKAAA